MYDVGTFHAYKPTYLLYVLWLLAYSHRTTHSSSSMGSWMAAPDLLSRRAGLDLCNIETGIYIIYVPCAIAHAVHVGSVGAIGLCK